MALGSLPAERCVRGGGGGGGAAGQVGETGIRNEPP